MFRIWNKKTQQYHHHIVIKHNGQPFDTQLNQEVTNLADYTINWYSGFNDLNNKQLYADDIVTFGAQNIIGRIVFEKGQFNIVDGQDRFGPEHLAKENVRKMGTLHENPEIARLIG